MNNLIVFNYGERAVRTQTINGEPWFALKDVCKVLEIGNSRDVAARLDNDEKGVDIVDTLGGKQELTFISESGLYSVILLSRKPEAKQFKRWITHEILPSIRKHGVYAVDELLNNPDLLINALQQLKAERKKNAEQARTLEKQKPKILFADAVSTSETTILVGELVKILKGNGVDMGQNRLYESLRKKGYLISRKGSDYNAPTQYAMNLGLFQVKQTAISHSDGHVIISKTTKITGKGQQYFINLFMERKLLMAEI